MDPIEELKENAKKSWSSFGDLEMVTASVAPRLVRWARVRPGAEVLDVGCGTGVVALTAARAGAKARGADLTPALLERARENAAIMGLDVPFLEADVEALPFPDASFDVVVSQFGHMFAPRPDLAAREMLRVLRPGGTIAFASWPPELYTGRMLALVARYGPPPPEGVPSPLAWGEPSVVRERLGAAVRDLTFTRDVLRFQVLSPQHVRVMNERAVGMLGRVARSLEASAPEKLAELRRELEALISLYFEDNHLRQDFLLTRATKA